METARLSSKSFNLKTECSGDFCARNLPNGSLIYVKCSSGFRDIGERCGQEYRPALSYRLEETMIRLIMFTFALTVATSAHAMPVPKNLLFPTAW